MDALAYSYFSLLKVMKPVFSLSTDSDEMVAPPLAVASSAVISLTFAAATGSITPFSLHIHMCTILVIKIQLLLIKTSSYQFYFATVGVCMCV